MTRDERDAFLAELDAAKRRANEASRAFHEAERAYEALWMDPRRRRAEEWARREAESGQLEVVA